MRIIVHKRYRQEILALAAKYGFPLSPSAKENVLGNSWDWWVCIDEPTPWDWWLDTYRGWIGTYGEASYRTPIEDLTPIEDVEPLIQLSLL